jgi:acyl-CoA reductase-like NAD-dependent aldehyde dehydrogenase
MSATPTVAASTDSDVQHPIYDAASGTVITQLQSASEREVDRIVQLARGAWPSWHSMGPTGRAQLMKGFAAAVRANLDELAELDSRNGGSPLRTTRAGVDKGAATVEFFAGLSVELTGKTIPATADHLHYTMREPFGVVGVITAYNHPSMFALARTAAALVAGNCVVLKPASATPLSALRLAEIASETLPEGVFNVVFGRAATGTALVQHPEVRRIAFTGSLVTGLHIQELAAQSGVVKHVSLQLGGKNPLVILPDADLDAAVGAAVEGMNFTRVMGQSCGSTSRVFVHANLYEPFVDELVRRVAALRLGDPTDSSTDMGPLVTAAHRQHVASCVADAISDGARLMAGGHEPGPPLDRGFYYPPTVFADVTPEMRINHDEVFGPVVGISSWTDEAAMLAAVNGVRYGLTASIYTHDLASAHRLAAAIQAGYIWINDVERRWIGIPFGGLKDSGTATEYSVDELFQFTQNKTISLALVE